MGTVARLAGLPGLLLCIYSTYCQTQQTGETMNSNDIDHIIGQLQALKATPAPPPVTGDAVEWKRRALEAEAKLDESRRQVELLLGEVAALRDALLRRIQSAS